jgi:hypothetical protein
MPAVLDQRLVALGGDYRLGSVAPKPPRPLLKALGRRRVPSRPPSAAQVEAERPFWGPHPDPAIAYIEDEFWRPGSRFLTALLSHALGKQVRPLAKAYGLPAGAIPGWGEVADLFRKDLDPEHLMAGWGRVIDKLVTGLFPATTKEHVARGMALRAHLLHKAGERVAAGDLPAWTTAVRGMSAVQRQAMAWTKARAVQYMTALDAKARDALMSTLLVSREAGEGVGQLQRRLFDGFSTLNRDWRRVALTETAAAVSNGALASVNPAEGWLAEWVAGPKACPFCKAMGGRRFTVVSPDAPKKDGTTQVWAGKSNHGRSAHKYSEKLGRFRTPDELWWPCLPVHPNCACTWVLRRKPKKP